MEATSFGKKPSGKNCLNLNSNRPCHNGSINEIFVFSESHYLINAKETSIRTQTRTF